VLTADCWLLTPELSKNFPTTLGGSLTMHHLSR
jgi:hypothetical protein